MSENPPVMVNEPVPAVTPYGKVRLPWAVNVPIATPVPSFSACTA